MAVNNRMFLKYLYGNSRIKEIFSGSSVSHAYILEGPKGSGKHTAALEIIASLVCFTRNDSESPLPLPCHECPACKKIFNNHYVDIIYIDNNDKTTLGVDQIRKIKDTLYTSPNEGSKKFYIIENAHLMTDEAQNALLLSLEEPPSFVMFFLLCESSDNLLDTIKSRAHIIKMELFKEEDIVSYVTERYGSSYDENMIKKASQNSFGTIGRTISYLENPNNPEYEIQNLAISFVENWMEHTLSETLAFVSNDIIAKKMTKNEICSMLDYSLNKIGSSMTSSNTSKQLVKKMLKIVNAINIAKEQILSNCNQMVVLYSMVLNSI